MLDGPSQLLLEQWLKAIDEFTEKITEIQEKIEAVAVDVEEVDLLMTAPGIALYSGLMIHSEIGEVERFDRAAEVVSYAGLDPVVRESGDSRREGSIGKEGNGNLSWILVLECCCPQREEPVLESVLLAVTEETKQAA